MATTTIEHLSQRLLEWFETLPWASELSALTPVLLDELARGKPVEPAELAARMGVPAADLLELLRRAPAEWDEDGKLVGFGLTLRPTRHRFEIEGRTLYTWCAPDALGFPTVLNSGAQIESPCFATGEPVRMYVAPDGVRQLTPATAVVSIVTPSAELAELRHSLCHQQHFFGSAEAASRWMADNPDGMVVPVADGFTLYRRLFARWLHLPGTRSDDRD